MSKRVDLMLKVKSQLLAASTLASLLTLLKAEAVVMRAVAALTLVAALIYAWLSVRRELQAVQRRLAKLQCQAQEGEDGRLAMSAALDAIAQVVIGLDGEDLITSWNRAATDLLAWSEVEAKGRSISDVLGTPAQRSSLEKSLGEMRAMVALVDRSCSNEALIRGRDGAALPVALTLAPRLGQGMTLLIRELVQDPVGNPKFRPELPRSHLRQMADNVPILIAYIDDQQRLQYANATFIRWIGIDPEAVHGKPFREVVGPARYAINGPLIQRALQGEQVVFEIDAFAQIGRYLRNELIPHRRPDGTVAGVYSLTTDITSMKEQERRLSELSRTDALTGLPNRRDGTQRLADAIARTRQSDLAMALMYLDIDHFKSINDTYGHAAGDEVLRLFSQRLRAAVRSVDTVARLAGDEFIVVLEGLHDAGEPQDVARKILAQIAAPMTVAGHSLVLGSSIGIAMCAHARCGADELLNEADQALYLAKGTGRGGFESYSREATQPA
jgi:diguanylate cyclase (GGDEF)-like protein/PAS domain S-box-containing protein